MEQKNTRAVWGGIGFFPLLTICFIVLKLTKVIAWSWLWVLAPLWIPYGLAAILAVVLLIVGTHNAIKLRK